MKLEWNARLTPVASKVGHRGLTAMMLIIINISNTMVVNDKESHHQEPPGHQLTSDRKFYGQN